MTGDPPTDAELEAIVNGIHGKTPEATERARARLRAQFADAKRPPLEHYRAQVAALGPDQRFGRRLAFANIALVVASLLVMLVPITINTFVRIAGGGTEIDPACLAEHTRRYCYFLATRDNGFVDLNGWVLVPFALAAAVLMALVWPRKRHYFAVKPSRPVVVIIALPIWFGVFSLLLAAFAGLLTWGFAPDASAWAEEFVVPVTIWGIVGVVGVLAALLTRSTTRGRSGRRR